MSLLSGIRFIPKDKREDERKSDRKEHKEHKKDKKRKRDDDKHSKHHKSSSRHDDSEDDEADMFAIAREEEERERAEWLKTKSKSSSNYGDTIGEYGKSAPPSQRDSVRFNAYQLQQQAVNSDDSDREEDTREERNVEVNTKLQEPATSSAPASMMTNQSAAQLFRDKLKKSAGKSLTSSVDQHKQHQARMEYKNLLAAKKDENEDMDEIFRHNVMKLGDHYKGTELGGAGAFGNGDKSGHDEEGDIDMKLFTRNAASSMVDEEKLKKQALINRQKHEQMTSRCRYCTLGNMMMLQNSVLLSKSEHAYVIWKSTSDEQNMGLVENCLEIVPISHKGSVLQCEEEVHTEVQRYKQCLTHMFEKEFRRSVVFTENAVGKYQHCHIEVTPVQRGMEGDAKMYFKEAFLSCDEEWSQYRKNIELTAERPLNKAVPSHFEYLMVEWGLGGEKSKSSSSSSSNGSDGVYGGLVHPVESARDISQDFCSDVLAGMLEVDTLKIRRRMNSSIGTSGGGNSATSGTMVRSGDAEKIDSFRRVWSRYDWSQYDV